MAPKPQSRSEKLITIGTILSVLFLIAFLLLRPVLFLPGEIKSRVAVDYEPPFLLEIQLPEDDVPRVFAPGELGVTGDYWGERRLVFASGYRSGGGGSDSGPCPHVWRGPEVGRIVWVVYHGDKITEVVEFEGRRGNSDFARTRRPRAEPDIPPGMDALLECVGSVARSRVVSEFLLPTWRCLPSWLRAASSPRSLRTKHSFFRYDEEGRVVEAWYEDQRTKSGGWNGRARSTGSRYFYDEAGKLTGELHYVDGRPPRGRLETTSEGGLYRDRRWYCRRDGTPHFRLVRSCGTWNSPVSWEATYGADGRLASHDNGLPRGIAGQMRIRDDANATMTTVSFDAAGRVACDSDGVAIAVDFWLDGRTWRATALYGLDGRLVPNGYPDCPVDFERFTKSGRTISNSDHDHRKRLVRLHFFRPF